MAGGGRLGSEVAPIVCNGCLIRIVDVVKKMLPESLIYKSCVSKVCPETEVGKGGCK